MLVVLATSFALQVTVAIAQTAPIQQTAIGDPTVRFSGIFGLGGYTCKQYTDTGRLKIYFDGMPNITILNWLVATDGGTKRVPGLEMPQDLQNEVDKVPPCAPNTHHAATPRKVTVGG